MNFAPVTLVELAALGLVVGVLGAMLGLGGSLILIPALNLVLGLNQHLHQAVGMIANFCVSLPAMWQHHRAGVVSTRVIRSAVPFAVVGVLLGVQLSEQSFFKGEYQKNLAALFGVFLVIVAIFHIRRLWTPASLSSSQAISEAHTSVISRWKAALWVGFPSGFIGGLLGIGGGLIAVPMQQLMLRLPLRNAIGNSAAIICGLSIVGAIDKNYEWCSAPGQTLSQPLGLVGVLLPFVVTGSFIGSRLTHTLPPRVVRTVLIVVLLFGAFIQFKRAFS